MACHVQEAKKKQSFNFPGRFFILFRRYLQQIYTSHTCIFNIAHKTFKSVGLVRVFNVFQRSLLCSASLHLFDEKQ